MNIESCATLLMLVATLASQGIIVTEAHSYEYCSITCRLKCAVFPKPRACLFQCMRNCIDPPVIATLEGQCNFDCVLSKCFDPPSDAKKVKGCVKLCAKGCEKS
ncbi:uncharacterized protein J3R85_004532 [Psidium guajava]|nr:uncharacterized protein J3R85_004532 [Psidium guajava]